MHDAENARKQQLAQATEQLGYNTKSPSLPHAIEQLPGWMLPAEETPEEAAIQRIVDEEWPVALLRKQIRRLGVNPQGRSRLDLATQLVETLLDRGRLQQALESVSEAARTYYAQILFNLRVPYYFDPRTGEIPVLQKPDVPEEQLLAEITGAGLAFERESDLLIPEALVARVPPVYLTVPDSMRIASPNAPKSAEPARLFRQIQRLLGLIRSGESRLRPQRYWKRGIVLYREGALPPLPVPEDARRLNQAGSSQQTRIRLMAPEPRLAPETLERWAEIFAGDREMVELIYHLLRAVGVLRPGSPVTLEPRHAEHFLSLAPGRQIALLLDCYETVQDYDVFWPHWRSGHVEVHWDYRPYRRLYDYQHTMLRALNRLRQTVLELLGLLPADVWLSFDEVAEVLGPLFILGTHQLPPESIDLVDAQGELPGFLRYYVQNLIKQILWRFGLSDVTFKETGALEAFRLRAALQDLLWRRRDALPMPDLAWDAQDIHWLKDPAGLALSPPVPVDVLRQVQRWAEPQGVDEEGALCYTLNLRCLYEVFLEGETPEALALAWEAGADAPPPEKLADWWAHWWVRYGHVQLYPRQALLEVQDEFAMQELQVAVPELREALLAKLTPQAALLSRDQVDALIRQFEEKGYMPKVIALESPKQGGR